MNRRSLFATVCLAFAGGATRAAEPGATIRGDLFDLELQQVVGTAVNVRIFSAGVARFSNTFDTGSYQFNVKGGLPMRVDLEFSREGRVTKAIHGLVLRDGKELVIDLVL